MVDPDRDDVATHHADDGEHAVSGAAEPPGQRTGELTELERMVLNVIIESIVDRGYSPTLREIQVACGLGSLTATRGTVRRLDHLGYVRTKARAARGLELTGVPAVNEPEDGLGTLWFLEAIERIEYPFLCRAAALAPTRQAGTEWLGHVIERTRQADALEAALARARARGKVPPAEVLQACAEAAPVYEAGLRRAARWIDHVVRESYGAWALVERGFVSANRPVRGLTSAIAEGNLATCRSGLRFADREMARLTAAATDRRRFEDELAEATADAAALWAAMEPYLDIAWPRVPSADRHDAMTAALPGAAHH